MRKIKENAREITAEKLADLRLNAAGIIAECRRSLINDFPFIGSIAMSLDIEPTRDAGNPTAATDGKTIYFDIDFLGSLDDDDRKFVVGHEIYHAVLAHSFRREGRDPKLFNIATDCEVNNILCHDGLAVPRDVVVPSLFRFPEDLSAEQYYELLLQKGQSQVQQMMDCLKSSKNNEDGDNMPSIGKTGSGNPAGKLEGQFDRHIESHENIFNDEVPENVADSFGKVGRDPAFSPEAKESNVDKMREIAVTAAQSYERQRGELPAHLKRFVEALLTSDIPWQEVLQAFITRTIGSKSDWNRPSKRFASSGIYLPSRNGDSVNIGVVLDTSASTSDYIQKFITEVNQIASAFSGYQLVVAQCDARVTSYEVYNDDNPLDPTGKDRIQVRGGGGTLLNPAITRIAEDDDASVDCIVVLTDGYTEHFTEDMDPGIPVLWMATNGDTDSNFDFGEFHKIVFK